MVTVSWAKAVEAVASNRRIQHPVIRLMVGSTVRLLDGEFRECLRTTM